MTQRETPSLTEDNKQDKRTTANQTIPNYTYDAKSNAENGYYIGIMSGTSLDAIDAVICSFAPEFELVATHSLDFPEQLKADLLVLYCQPSTELRNGLSEIEQYGKASIDYARLAAQCVHELLNQSSLHSEDIVNIGCHGQTVRHRPELGFTLQLLDANLLAELTGISVIYDFRMRDMAVGGQGAPLVPAFHKALFCDDERHRVLLNLGGIANITVLPAREFDPNHNKVTGYDTGPANLLLDAWCLKHTGNAYDENGDWAKTGRVDDKLLAKLLTHEFFAKATPKSTGREDFHLGWLSQALLEFSNISSEDVQATLVELTAVSASSAIMQTGTELGLTAGDLYVCGGGAYNTYLLSRLAQHLPHWQVTTTKDISLSPTWVEGSAFAWLARQHELGLAGNLPAVTGATKPVVLGVKCGR